MPGCATRSVAACMAQQQARIAAQQQAAAARSRTPPSAAQQAAELRRRATPNKNLPKGRGGSSASAGSSAEEDALESNRPPQVAIPNDGDYGGGGGHVVELKSPGLSLKKKGAGPAFTPIRETSSQSGALDSDRSHSSNIGAGFFFLHRTISKLLDLINSIAVQSTLYLSYVIVFQLLTASIRLKEEYHFDKMIADTFLENHFDASHNSFQTMRRVADVYEWGNNVLIPGLFANAGPCAPDVGGTGAPGYFRSATDKSTPTDLTAALASKGCNDDAWPDGHGSFHLSGATGWTVEEVAQNFDLMDWSEGIVIKQVRVLPTAATKCHTKLYGGACLPEIAELKPLSEQVGGVGGSNGSLYATSDSDDGNVGGGVSLTGAGAVASAAASQLEFGYNWTEPTAPLSHPWRYFTPSELGAKTTGIQSAAVPSFRTFEAGGFVAVIIPFLSRDFLPEERGTSSQVTDFRQHAISRAAHGVVDSAEREVPSYFCVRLSWNGEHIHQLCDPNDPSTNRTTGVVRLAVEEFFNDMKRAHYIDRHTRSVTITLPFRSNYLAVRSRVTLMVELTATGAVLPSYDIETRVESEAKLAATRIYVNIAFIMCFAFIFIECIEICKDGVGSYFTDPWNLMDWMNFGVFFLTWLTLQRGIELADLYGTDPNGGCDSLLCQTVGYRDDWDLMETMRQAKLYLSLCVCIQLLKMIKFLKQLIPKMALATAVLYKGMMDLLFFGVVFFLTMFAFAMMFYVQLGPNMEGYNDLPTSVFSLSRALFGDFDVPDILNNSRGYMNVGLFILYLFVAVFVMLSMFLAILGESQAAVRMDQDERRRLETAEPEYGVFSYAYDGVANIATAVRDKLRPAPRAKCASPSSMHHSSSSSSSRRRDDDIELGTTSTRHEEDEEKRGAPSAEAAALPRMPFGGLGLRGGSSATVPVETPRTSRSASMRTEIRDLSFEVASIAERQKRISSHLKNLDPKQLSLQLGRLAHSIEALERRAAGKEDAVSSSSTARPSLGISAGGTSLVAATRHPPPLKAAPPPRQMPGPLLGVCLGGGHEAENRPTNPTYGGPAGGVPAQEPSPGALGWAKARRALNTGRIQQMLREEGDTPMRPKREKAPSMRREVRRIAKAAQEQQHQHQHRERRESGGGRRDSNGGDETSFVI